MFRHCQKKKKKEKTSPNLSLGNTKIFIFLLVESAWYQSGREVGSNETAASIVRNRSVLSSRMQVSSRMQISSPMYLAILAREYFLEETTFAPHTTLLSAVQHLRETHSTGSRAPTHATNHRRAPVHRETRDFVSLSPWGKEGGGDGTPCFA